MLVEFCRWWLGQMSDVFAAPQAHGQPVDGLLLIRGQGGWQVRRRQGRRLRAPTPFAPTPFARARLGRRPGPLILVSQDRMLRRIVALPPAAASGLETLFRYELDRLTPFSAENAIWSAQPARRGATAESMDVELLVLPRAGIAADLAELEGLGVRPLLVEANLADGTARDLPLATPDPVAARRRHQRLAILGCVCAALALATLATPFIRQQRVLDAAAEETARLRGAVNEAQALRPRLSGEAAAGPVAAGRRAAPGALRALAAMANALPDDTWLASLSLRRGQMLGEGQTTGAASRLIPLLAASPHLRNPSFTAAVVHGDAGNELFALQVEFVP